MPSKWFHTSPSDGCTILSGLYRVPCLCHVIYLADSSLMYSRWILGTNGRYHKIFIGTVSCFLWPSPESTSRYLEDLHFGQYFSCSCSFLKRTHSFGQACICSYGIFSALRSFYASYMVFDNMWSFGSRVPTTANTLSKPS